VHQNGGRNACGGDSGEQTELVLNEPSVSVLWIDAHHFRYIYPCLSIVEPREEGPDDSLMDDREPATVPGPSDRSQLLAPPKADSSHKNRTKSRKRCTCFLGTTAAVL